MVHSGTVFGDFDSCRGHGAIENTRNKGDASKNSLSIYTNMVREAPKVQLGWGSDSFLRAEKTPEDVEVRGLGVWGLES